MKQPTNKASHLGEGEFQALQRLAGREGLTFREYMMKVVRQVHEAETTDVIGCGHETTTA